MFTLLIVYMRPLYTQSLYISKIANMYIKYIVYSPFLAASYEERSDPESLRMKKNEKDHTFI
jgi:hypothetical protein